MISFTCDYNEGAHPEILRRLIETNLDQEPGYGADRFTVSAIAKIRDACRCPDANVMLLTGGTQTNATIIDAMLPRYGAVIAADTAHIAVHEAGAIELNGHKVLTLPAVEGRITAAQVGEYMRAYYADPTWQHMAHPEMVYLSFPTEYGTVYSRAELEAIGEVCREYGLRLYVDGARLGYGLAAADVTLPQLAQLCDAFYIGGTKVGALCGEAVVFPRGDAPMHLFTIVKQHGALVAKGRLLGIQFDTLFTDDLYFRISREAVGLAMKMRRMFENKGISLYIDSPTNQQFPILTETQMRALDGKVLFEVWQELPPEEGERRCVTRFATSWATSPEHIEALEKLLC